MSIKPPIAMTIAGSDSGGGAGIQADLKTFAFHCVHGASVVTCVTAQNTQGVTHVVPLPIESIQAQWEAVITDMPVASIKTGMLLNDRIIATVARKLVSFGFRQVVVDPVMVSRSGAQLLDHAAITAMKQLLVPLALILTPNRYEAQLLAEREIHTIEDMQFAAERIYKQGCAAVLIKGGGLAPPFRGTDVWFDGNHLEVLSVPTIDTPHTHGTGCTLSAAIAAKLAQGKERWEAVKQAKEYVSQALHHSLSIGRGQGPVGHFYPLLSLD